MKGVGKSLAMNGLVGNGLVDDIANFRIINLDCGNWSICLFHKLASLVGRSKGFVVEMRVENTRIFSVEKYFWSVKNYVTIFVKYHRRTFSIFQLRFFKLFYSE